MTKATSDSKRLTQLKERVKQLETFYKITSKAQAPQDFLQVFEK